MLNDTIIITRERKTKQGTIFAISHKFGADEFEMRINPADTLMMEFWRLNTELDKAEEKEAKILPDLQKKGEGL